MMHRDVSDVRTTIDQSNRILQPPDTLPAALCLACTTTPSNQPFYPYSLAKDQTAPPPGETPTLGIEHPVRSNAREKEGSEQGCHQSLIPARRAGRVGFCAVTADKRGSEVGFFMSRMPLVGRERAWAVAGGRTILTFAVLGWVR